MREDKVAALCRLEGSRLDLLVVEPSESLRLLLSAILRPVKSSIVWAGSIEHAFMLTLRERPDLVLTDHSPDIHGAALCQAIRREPVARNTPIVLMSAFAQHLSHLDYFDYDCDHVVYKPFRCKEIYEAIGVALNCRAKREAMKIHVLYKSGMTGYVDQLSLDKLIEQKKIFCFRRKGGVAVLGRDPIRTDSSSHYQGPERRQQAA